MKHHFYLRTQEKKEDAPKVDAKMPLNLGDEMPNFEADTTIGKIKFHDWLGDS